MEASYFLEMTMMTRFYVNYFVDGRCASYCCENKRDASNFARKVSKNGNTSQIYRCSGIIDNGIFYETESTHVANYRDGKRQ